jgi:hypothetical protein
VEFSSVLSTLTGLIPEGSLTQISDLTELTALYHQGEFADLLAVVQTWSDEFPFSEFIKLPGFGPLSRVICCHGPWCVSDGRSHQDWPLALRVPLEHFGAALRRELQQLTSAPLPWTAGRDEIFHRRSAAFRAASRCVVRVISPDRRLAEMWAELLRKAGFPIAVEGSAGGGQLVLWDVDPWNAKSQARWNDFRRQHPATKMIALAGFVTPDIANDLRDRGANAVLCKLLPLDAMLLEIQAVIGS